MKCDRAREWLSDLIDGSIRPAQSVVLEAHLAVCASCAAESEHLRSLWRDLDGLAPVEAPATLRATIWQRIQAAREEGGPSESGRPARVRRSPIPAWVRVVGVASAVVALLAMARVTVPGRYRAAGWFTWWSAGSSSRQNGARSGPVVEGAPQVVIPAKAATQDEPGGFVMVTLKAPGAALVPARLTVMRGVHELAHLTVTLTAGSRQYRVPLPARSAFPTELRIEWSGADHVTRTRSLPLR